MARTKNYIEEEVLEKAMRVFWRNGYQNTSVQMLEKAMGINKFSIYSSFGSKHELFQKSLSFYQKNSNKIFDKLKKSTNGIEGIKTFFYDSIAVPNEIDRKNGCMVTNTYNEFSDLNDEIITREITKFMEDLKQLFIEKISHNTNKADATVIKKANYLLLAKHGLAAASRVNNKQEIHDYIEMVFKNV